VLLLKFLALLLSSGRSVLFLLKLNLNLLEPDQDLLHKVSLKLVANFDKQSLTGDFKFGIRNLKLFDLSRLVLNSKAVNILENELKT
jgi:hypothetical protein